MAKKATQSKSVKRKPRHNFWKVSGGNHAPIGFRDKKEAEEFQKKYGGEITAKKL